MGSMVSTRQHDESVTDAPYTGILVRDSLQDNGIVPSPGYAYFSPDIICVQQNTYSNPASQFGTGASYAADPNLALINGQNNNFYVRGFNMGTVPQGGNMYVYWSKASLLLTPNLWFNQPLTAIVNKQAQNFVPLPSVAGNQIGVGAIPFNWTPPTISPNDHFCLIGAVNTVPPYTWPPAQAPTFPSSDAFVLWVRTNQNICWRNLSLVSNPNQPEWDRLDSFANPWTTGMAMLVSAQCANVPVGTTVQLLSTAVGINTTQTITSPNQTVYSQGATCPAGFNGIVETVANLPSGTSQWPTGALITTTVYVARPMSSPVARFAHDFGADAQHPSVLAAIGLLRKVENTNDNGVLVAIGNTATGYQPGV